MFVIARGNGRLDVQYQRPIAHWFQGDSSAVTPYQIAPAR